MFDRLPCPWGLVRAGVAPDHPETKRVVRIFQQTAAKSGFRFHLNVEVGRHLTHEELLAHHHAVIYAVGAPRARSLGIPGEDLPGSHSAAEFVAWYNGHPDFADRQFDLSGPRAVVVGNGNVALDVARIMLLDPRELAATDIAEHALAALAQSRIEEVVVLGRRGSEHAAFSTPQLLALAHLPDVDVVVDQPGSALGAGTGPLPGGGGDDPAGFAARLKQRLVSEYAAQATRGARKRITLRFFGSPVEIMGDERVTGLRVARTGISPDGSPHGARTERTETIEAALVVRAIGFRGQPVPGVPFDEELGTVPHRDGRVLDPRTDQPLPGVYTAGWAKRGASGVIGTNDKCAGETVGQLLADHAAGLLPEPVNGTESLDELIGSRRPDAVDGPGWDAIDTHECQRGEASGRPRAKLVRVEEMVRVADAASR